MPLNLSKHPDSDNPASRLLSLLERGEPDIHVSGVKGSYPSLLSSLLFRKLEKSFLIVTSSHDSAQEIYHELAFFRGKNSAGCAEPSENVLLFSSPETHPYENVLSHCGVSARRMWTLYRLCDSQEPVIVVASIRALLQKTIPVDLLIDSCSTVSNGDEIDRENFTKKLVEGGYTRVSLVEDRGDFSIRGEIMDVFPPGYDKPLRIDLFGDTVETIRLFDPVSQRSCQDILKAVIVPVREIILSESVVNRFEGRVEKKEFEEIFSTRKGKSFFDNIASGFLPSGAEYALSYIYPSLSTFFDYLPEERIMFWWDKREIDEALVKINADVSEYYFAAIDERRVVSPPEEIFINNISTATQQVLLEPWNIEGPSGVNISFAVQSNEDIRREIMSFDTSSGMLSSLAEKIEQWLLKGVRVLLICHTRTQSERLKDLFSDYGLDSDIITDMQFNDAVKGICNDNIKIIVGSLATGFRYEDGLLVIITEEEIFGEKRRRIKAPVRKQGSAVADFSDLKDGDLIVHRDNGIGLFKELLRLDAGGTSADYLHLEYLGGDRLYMPVDRINLINKYEGSEDDGVQLDKLGGVSWKRTKKRVKEAIEKIANDLIELYSARKVYKGHSFSPVDHYYREFEAAFPFEETPDQIAAIEDVKNDMSSDKPMDRLICGDVGFGKTEVALRAAFRAVMDGKQVSVLVPTTVLAQQHFLTFKERFKAYPVKVDILSRFRIRKDQKRILEEVSTGKVDIIVGTHRLVQKDVSFKDLGLIVIDEEHRFGVKHKEQLQKIRKTVDVLTLTATPIPRTLQLSLFGIRNFSTIETPPEDRLSIRTVMTHFEDDVIKDAISRELKRGGQVFFVHDRVHSISAMGQFLKKLVPEMTLGIAHGQMNEKELESSMMQFVKKEVDVLLCTTIIESGLDFPTANTIIINNAHRLGLAQMYQLRGRVGRGKVRAYAYLLIPGTNILSRDAAKRLEAVSEFTELGSGYRLAARDLQIRGAGNILGHSQSGRIASVGIDMYLEILNDTIKERKGEKFVPRIEPEVNLNIPAFIPEEYVPDVNQRLLIYRRFSTAFSDGEIIDIEEELLDRFGQIPVEVENLIKIAGLKNLLRANMIISVDSNKKEIILTFHENAEKQLDKVLAIVSSDQKRFRFTKDNRLIAGFDRNSDIILEIKRILK
jgi:transcription-repair coupling factor (superfamily II helicase)